MKKILGALFALTFIIAPTTALAADPVGDQCTVLGTEGNDTLTGTSSDDVICGLGGDDTITGLGGNDSIYGGAGDDTIYGGEGADLINGGTGEDDLFGDAGTDTLNGDEDTDGLNGGADRDTLNGGAGDDVCVDFSADAFIRGDCKVDKQGPIVTNLVIDEGYTSIDTTSGSAKLYFTFDVVDHGTGVRAISFALAPASKPTQTSIGAWSVASSAACNDSYNRNNCLVSGTINNGHYKASITLPANLAKTTFVFGEVSTEDRLGNRRVLKGPKVATAGLTASFVQTGTPDLSAPVLSNFELVATGENEQRKARVSFSDASKVNYLVLTWVGELSRGWTVQSVITITGVRCTDTHGVLDACLYSGDETNGVIEFPLLLGITTDIDKKYLYKAQNMIPVSIEARDKVGNSKTYKFTKAEKTLLTVYKSWVYTLPTDDKDKSAPKIKSLTVTPTTIDTSSEDATVTITARVTDSGMGVKLARIGSDFMVSLQPTGAAAVTCTQTANGVGTANDAVFTFSCTIPKFAQTGQWEIGIETIDMSQRHNQMSYSAAQLRSKGLTSYITNG